MDVSKSGGKLKEGINPVQIQQEAVIKAYLVSFNDEEKGVFDAMMDTLFAGELAQVLGKIEELEKGVKKEQGES